MSTPFLEELKKRSPKFTVVLAHKVYADCLKKLKQFVRLDRGGTLILITGPSEAGKTELLAFLAAHLMSDVFRDVQGGMLPVIGATALLSRDAKTSPKQLCKALLHDAGHPLYDLGKIAEANHYRPSRRAAETDVQEDLRHTIRTRETAFVLVDDGQYLVRAKDEEYKADLVESLKSLVTPTSSLVLVGSYELAEIVLSRRSHVAARQVTIHLRPYGAKSPEDRSEWRRILREFNESKELAFESPTTLLAREHQLLLQCHGEVGILEKRLLDCAMSAAAAETRITPKIIDSCSPIQAEWDVVHADIQRGQSILKRYGEDGQEAHEGSDNKIAQKKKSTEKTKKRLRAPFRPNPRRAVKKVKV